MTVDWVEELKRRLRELGYSFEAEEAIRIHVGDLVAEAAGSRDEGYHVTISIPLPSGGSEDPDYYAGILSLAARLLVLLGSPLEYSLDTSLPDYPTLYATRRYSSPKALVDEFITVLERIKGFLGSF